MNAGEMNVLFIGYKPGKLLSSAVSRINQVANIDHARKRRSDHAAADERTGTGRSRRRLGDVFYKDFTGRKIKNKEESIGGGLLFIWCRTNTFWAIHINHHRPLGRQIGPTGIRDPRPIGPGQSCAVLRRPVPRFDPARDDPQVFINGNSFDRRHFIDIAVRKSRDGTGDIRNVGRRLKGGRIQAMICGPIPGLAHLHKVISVGPD